MPISTCISIISVIISTTSMTLAYRSYRKAVHALEWSMKEIDEMMERRRRVNIATKKNNER